MPMEPLIDIDPQETREWLDALEALIQEEGEPRAEYLLQKLFDTARRRCRRLRFNATTAYVNTIPLEEQPPYPGDLALEERITALVRWNALAMVVRANREHPELGGHIASYASAADLFEVGFNHFFRAAGDPRQEGVRGADLVYFQPHSAPGVYARAFLEGRLSEEQLAHYRRETSGRGLSSYCHPWLMPDFWQFPTGSMGLGPINAIYQARFMKYLHDRGLLDTQGRKVWAFVGDGEMDEPESLAGLSLAAREKLDNLIFVVNCNLQRLDGPVRGNGSIIQELEGLFTGAGWNVIKLLWGSDWDPLFARDREGVLLRRLHETVDGELQKYAATDGRFNREHFFNKYPELKQLVAHLSDDDIDRLHRGGHDPIKIYAAYHAAVNHRGQPTVILAQTKKGYGMGHWGQGKMGAHQQKKLEDEALLAFRDRFHVPLSDEEVKSLRFLKPADDMPEMKYLHARRKALGGYLPARSSAAPPLPAPPLDTFAKILAGSGDREESTTLVFVRLLSQLLREPAVGQRIVPIVADEARTFGMQSLFRQVAIYSSVGQLYEPEDRDELLYYKEAKDGQILEEGITEAGAISSWLAAATSYSTHGIPMVPFYIFYSMFGFQRVGDLIWAAADSRPRGFLLGATSGRTTLAGEGLQHQDGSSHLIASTVPNCRAYDPCFGYELAVILQDGMRRMLEAQEDVFYYVTLMNENYAHPAKPQGVEADIVRGMYLFKRRDGAKVQLLGSGALLREALAAAQLLEQDWGVAANVWSVTSFTELRRDGMAVARRNRLQLDQARTSSHVEKCLGPTEGPVVAVSDYVSAVADLIRPWVPRRYVALGTDGFGRSDTRKSLRRFFEVSREHIAFAALAALHDEGMIERSIAEQAAKRYGIDPTKPAPWSC
ncbi:alpha-ketoglutarate dehydrogenase [Pelomicrobium methylotrophicum]|uniref:Pyruvate dehydrogenase E1 component n=2 Tax=Pelomicrobium methylotrophicum TaxID=2602750 RepID=A0A5C7EPW4_9PROT|nr:alpha-ketoglutarate dehydrogenase [Pelomicrobium methylotrophicum]TXF10532.1 alpha-ketoglutarate dehydrogenase [Pelomicrobium methylotrophicum]